MTEFKPPQQIQNRNKKSIFLAGTIDMGNSEDWQFLVKNILADKDVDIYNPRRASWDSSWIQEFENPQFYQQVNWELSALEKADFIVLNLLPDSKSPISLLELGLFAKSGKLLVCCPKQFYRSGNVQIVCDRYNIPLFTDIEELIKNIKL
jgi:hypothetical protein